jgi:Ca2+-binding EF-hand superfamily protein
VAQVSARAARGMGNVLEGLEGAPCCASEASNAPSHASQGGLSGDAQAIKGLLVEAQSALHPSEARVSALFDLYDTDGNGVLDPTELKNVMLDVYKGAIATLSERCLAAAEQATAAAAAVTEVDRRWDVSSERARPRARLLLYCCRAASHPRGLWFPPFPSVCLKMCLVRQEGEKKGWAADAPERAGLLEERSSILHRQKLSDWNEANVKNCLAELNRHFVYIRSDPRPEAVLELITALDRDHDGQIDKAEFVAGFCQHMKDSFATLDDAEIDAELARQEDSALMPSVAAVVGAADASASTTTTAGGGGGGGMVGEISAGEEALRSLLTEEEWI